MVLLTRLAKVAFRRSNEADVGMRLRQHVALSFLNDHDGATQQVLGEALCVDANNLVLLLNELEADGLVERRRDPLDRRRHLVHITAEGRRALDRAERAQERVEDGGAARRSTPTSARRCASCSHARWRAPEPIRADGRRREPGAFPASARVVRTQGAWPAHAGERSRTPPDADQLAPAGTCCVMQCTPPPPKASVLPGTPTISRPGSSARSRLSASASMSGSCSPSGTIAAPLQR